VRHTGEAEPGDDHGRHHTGSEPGDDHGARPGGDDGVRIDALEELSEGDVADTARVGYRFRTTTGDGPHLIEQQAYYDFENAFPLADLWLGIAALLALVTLVRRRPSALLWLIATGAAGLYLGSMDLLYDLEHNIFGKGGGGAFEAVIVVLTWVFSITLLRYAWTRRGELLAGGSGVPEDSDGPPPAP
jgi:hypothetical protein